MYESCGPFDHEFFGPTLCEPFEMYHFFGGPSQDPSESTLFRCSWKIVSNCILKKYTIELWLIEIMGLGYFCKTRVSLTDLIAWQLNTYERCQGWDSPTLKLYYLRLQLSLFQWKTMLVDKTVIVELGESQPSILHLDRSDYDDSGISTPKKEVFVWIAKKLAKSFSSKMAKCWFRLF